MLNTDSFINNQEKITINLNNSNLNGNQEKSINHLGYNGYN